MVRSNHWILRQPDQVSKAETMASGTEVLFGATSDRLPVIQQRMEELQTPVFRPDIVLLH